ncbi:MAG: lipoate--protein ligase [Bacteroidales bacterium]|nr:lipoate--protein ligase [Bacteroidales bacterium]
MRYVFDTSTDPYFNMAAEEYLLTHVDEPVFRLWRNASSVIVGKNQNSLAEIDTEFVRNRNIPVVRRLSGGGAVFHDLGNINYTFMETRRPGEDSAQMFRRFTRPVLDALQALGVNAVLEGRNDLLIDGRKFSGNALCVHRDRVLQHGTLLFNASIGDLAGALRTRPEKFVDKGVKSNVSRVTNIAEHLPVPMTVEEFWSYLQRYFAGEALSAGMSGSMGFSPEELEVIEQLRKEKYATDAWNYGRSPQYDFVQGKKFPCGWIELRLNVKGGKIEACKIQGDYFFVRPTEEVEEALTGLLHQYDDLYQALKKLPLNDYFGAVQAEDLMGLFF